MKLKVLILKKKHLIYFCLILLLIILLIIFSSTSKSSSTFNVSTKGKTVKTDLTGDGEEDILYVKSENDNYLIQVNTKDTSLYIEPSTKLNSLGKYNIDWPMKITLFDINRDKTPEIFVQSSTSSTPIQHAFIWSKDNFKDILCNTNNILGFLDSVNNKTPKVISGSLANGNITFSNYIYIQDTLQSFECNYPHNFIGKDTIATFIGYIESLPDNEAYKPKGIFNSSITGKDLSTIGKLCSENNYYVFKDAKFTDTKFDKDGKVAEVLWSLRFNGRNRSGTGSKIYTVNVTLKPTSNADDEYYFKIFTITLE